MHNIGSDKSLSMRYERAAASSTSLEAKLVPFPLPPEGNTRDGQNDAKVAKGARVFCFPSISSTHQIKSLVTLARPSSKSYYCSWDGRAKSPCLMSPGLRIYIPGLLWKRMSLRGSPISDSQSPSQKLLQEHSPSPSSPPPSPAFHPEG